MEVAEAETTLKKLEAMMKPSVSNRNAWATLKKLEALDKDLDWSLMYDKATSNQSLVSYLDYFGDMCNEADEARNNDNPEVADMIMARIAPTQRLAKYKAVVKDANGNASVDTLGVRTVKVEADLRKQLSKIIVKE